MILSVLYLLSGLGGLIVMAGISFFVSKALRVRGIEAVVEAANSTITLYDSRITVLEANLKDIGAKYEEIVIRNRYLEELVLQRSDMKLVHTKLNKILRVNGHEEHE